MMQPIDPNTINAREMLVLGEAAVYSIAEVEALEAQLAERDKALSGAPHAENCRSKESVCTGRGFGTTIQRAHALVKKWTREISEGETGHERDLEFYTRSITRYEEMKREKKAA